MAPSILPLFTLLVLAAIAVYANNSLDCNDKLNGRSCEDFDSPEDLTPNTGRPSSKPNSPLIDIRPPALQPSVEWPLDKTKPTSLPPGPDPTLTVSPSLSPADLVTPNDTTLVDPPITVSPSPSLPDLVVPIDHVHPQESKPTTTMLCPTTTSPTETLSPPIVAPVDPYLAFCGKKNKCYQWFDDEWQLAIDGYQPCTPKDKLRAARYCCV